jgi:competence protein ComEC
VGTLGGPLEARFLHPTAADYAERRSTNAMSCVLLLTFGAYRLLLTGDVPARQETELLARHPVSPVTLLAAPHHGSRNSSSPALLAAAQPRSVLFQAGYRNRFGHPDPSVVADFRALDAQISRSDHHGALPWRLRANVDPVPTVAAARQQLRRYWHSQPGERLRPPADAEGDRLPDDLEPATVLPSAPAPVELPFALEP